MHLNAWVFPYAISIHALREEGDNPGRVSAGGQPNFYPRPPRGGRRPAAHRGRSVRPDFYPRPPRGGRPSSPRSFRIGPKFLSTPSARRATALLRAHRPPRRHFYPRPPRGGRPILHHIPAAIVHFYPRPPRGGRPDRLCYIIAEQNISIHALREEGDRTVRLPRPPRKHFYPRPPRGGRPDKAASNYRRQIISIHALREEGDQVTAKRN